MTPEEELKLQGDQVTELLNKISGLKQQAMEEHSHFYVANILGRCYEMIKVLHIQSVQTIKENLNISNNRRLHYAGQALNGLLASNGLMFDTVDQAYRLADEMVDYGRQESKVKETDSESNALEPDSNNNEQ